MIEARDITKTYPMGPRLITAVRRVSFAIREGEILGLVGESGSGKSTLAKMLARLISPTSGQILFRGEPLQRAPRHEIQMIFQDPFSALNPRMRVGDIIREPAQIHRRSVDINQLLDLVGLSPHTQKQYPHEFSGGQRQRIGIARALALHPRFLICDEPVSALDVSIQAQILLLLQKLQRDLKLTYLFIAHDLAVVRYISTRVAVMYRGSFVEVADADALFAHPRHPYTRLLVSSVPDAPHPPTDLPTLGPSQRGCPFAPRCPLAQPLCREQAPPLRTIAPNHDVACHLA
jgi:oligopeptide/dipeptide ABC transporter ATP-binding protein